MKSNHIAISLVDGRTVRDLFFNGLLSYLKDDDIATTIFTEAVRTPEFTEMWADKNIRYAYMAMELMSKWGKRAYWIRQEINKTKLHRLIEAYVDLESKMFMPASKQYSEILSQQNISLAMATHTHLHYESRLVNTAKSLAIPTLGLVRSWDNILKGIYTHPDHMAVWNDINKTELMEMAGYREDRIHVIGAPQFDTYFNLDNIWSRDEFLARFRLDSDRPIILFATLGHFHPYFDETCWMSLLTELIDNHQLKDNPQVICRLHPMSQYSHFHRFADNPNVRMSYVLRYWPALQWYMTDQDMIEMANMLYHCTIVITPASTVTLESAIFDKPTIVPIFHTHQPEFAEMYFSVNWLGKHFGRIDNLRLVPIIRQAGQFADAINLALTDCHLFQAERKQLVSDYATYTDGKSTKRLADLIRRFIST